MNGDDIDFSYDGNDEEARRLASEPKKIKSSKVVPVKKKEQKPIILPNKPLEAAIDPTSVRLEEQPTSTIQKEIPAIEKVITQTPKDIQKISDFSTPTVVVAAAAAAVSVAVLSNAFKAKTKSKSKGKTKLENKKPDNRSEEEKKEEEQKQCDSKSDKVQSLLDETNNIVSESVINKIQIKEDKEIKEKIKALNLEMILINKTIKKLEENIHKKKSK